MQVSQPKTEGGVEIKSLVRQHVRNESTGSNISLSDHSSLSSPMPVASANLPRVQQVQGQAVQTPPHPETGFVVQPAAPQVTVASEAPALFTNVVPPPVLQQNGSVAVTASPSGLPLAGASFVPANPVPDFPTSQMAAASTSLPFASYSQQNDKTASMTSLLAHDTRAPVAPPPGFAQVQLPARVAAANQNQAAVASILPSYTEALQARFSSLPTPPLVHTFATRSSEQVTLVDDFQRIATVSPSPHPH